MSYANAPRFRLEVHRELGSTSDAAIAAAAVGAAGGLAILAHRQTAPRGSRGRRWVEPDGNLALSVLLRPPEASIGAGGLVAAAAVALHEALAPALDAPARLSIKWPNDLLLDGAKIAGILVETGLDGAGVPAWAVIGFGANLRARPMIPGRRTACAAEAGIAPEPEALAAALLARLAAWLAAAPAARAAAWSARAHPPGTAMRVATGGGERAGRFAGLAPDGALRLATEGGEVAIASGTVWLADSEPGAGAAGTTGRGVPCFS